MSYQVGKPLSSVQTSSSLRQRAAKTIKKKKKDGFRRHEATSYTQQASSQWTQKINEAKTMYPWEWMRWKQIDHKIVCSLLYSAKYTVYSQSLSCASWLWHPKEEKEKGIWCLIHEKDSRKHWDDWRKNEFYIGQEALRVDLYSIFSLLYSCGHFIHLSLQLLYTAWTKDCFSSEEICPSKGLFGKACCPYYPIASSKT